MAMAMRRAAALGARHILAAPATASSRITGRRHMSSLDAGAAMEKIRAAGLLRTQGLIGGKWVDAYDGKTIEVQNPATGEVLANVACMGNRETSDAIASANTTFSSWSKLTASERSKALRKWHDLLISHKEELALLMTLEQGKPMKEALGEVNYGASFIEYFAEEAKRVYGDIIPPTLPDRRILVLKQPIGVVGAITPWNFPLAMITRKVGPALACGCTVVVKPSEFTPLTALAAADLALQAGIPAGALNVVMGNAPEIGDELMQSTQVRKITFTGSTAVGKKLMAGSANTLKKVSLELGGNAPCIVFDDADIEVAVKGSLAAKFRNSGQTCVCANRILVQEGIYEKFASAFVKAVQSLQEIASIRGGLRWPLNVFGMVTARDVLDIERKRNFIYARARSNCQTITEEHPYLALTGPSRAVVTCIDPGNIEIVLKVKGATESEDRDLSFLVLLLKSSSYISYRGDYPSKRSTLKLEFHHIENAVEATISVRLTGGSSLPPGGFQGVFTASTASIDDVEVLLLAFRDGQLPIADDGTISLSRRVVSVGFRYDTVDWLKVSVVSGSDDDEHAARRDDIVFKPKRHGRSCGVLNIGTCKMQVVVAWSVFE